MPVDITSTLSQGESLTFLSKGLTRIFKSRIYTTSVLTVMIIILIMIMYPCKQNTPTWLLLKLGFYVFLVSIGVIFIHDCVILNENNEKRLGGEDSDMINAVTNNNDDIFKENIPVKIAESEKSEDIVAESDTDNDTVGGDAESIFNLYGV
jgi:hypothetical protein